MSWPKKHDREKYEIDRFIELYQKLPHGRKFGVVSHDREQPDCVVRDLTTNERFGIELTSVYLNDRSVPDVHKTPNIHFNDPVYSDADVMTYKQRILQAMSEKVSKARNGYDLTFPLILSVYLNEYIARDECEEDELKALVDENENLFNNMQPFKEIVFLLPSGNPFSVIP